MSSSKNLEYKKTSFLNKTNSAFIEEMYVRFLNQDPNLADSWKDYFEGIQDEAEVILNDINGQVFSIFILTIAAAEAAIGLAILVIYFRNKGEIDITQINQLKD